MGLRGELFSTRMACDGRTYFFNVKENRMGDLFLSIVESKPMETGDFDRRSIVIFQENAEEFIKAFKKSVEAMEEAAPSVRAAKPPRIKRDAKIPRDDGREDDKRLADDERPRHYIDTGKPRGRSGVSDSAGSAHPARTGRPGRPAEPGKPAPKGKVYCVSPKAAAESADKRRQAAAPKPAARRMTVRKVADKSPRSDRHDQDD